MTLEKLQEYDFYKRINGRLRAIRNKYVQVNNNYEETKCPIKKKVFEARLKEISLCISEIEFIKNNIEDDIKDNQ